MPNQVSTSVRLILKPFLFDYKTRAKRKYPCEKPPELIKNAQVIFNRSESPEFSSGFVWLSMNKKGSLYIN